MWIEWLLGFPMDRLAAPRLRAGAGSRMRLLMALRADEAEPVTIEVTDRVLTLTLDDGEPLVFDLEEFDDAIAAELRVAEEAA